MAPSRRYPAHVYAVPRHARRSALGRALADDAAEALAWHPTYRRLADMQGCQVFWTELGRAMQRYDAATVAATCEILATTLMAGRVRATQAARITRDWRLGRF